MSWAVTTLGETLCVGGMNHRHLIIALTCVTSRDDDGPTVKEEAAEIAAATASRRSVMIKGS